MALPNPTRPRPLPDDEIAMIVARYKDGATAKELALAFHRDHYTIQRALGLARFRKPSQRAWIAFLNDKHYRPDELAWTAGFIDGEGCLYLTVGFTPVLAVRNTCRASIEKLASLFSGRVRCPGLAPTSRRRIWEWAISGDAAICVIGLLRPWLIVKASQADVMIEFHAQRAALSLEEKVAIYQTVRDLKRVES